MSTVVPKVLYPSGRLRLRRVKLNSLPMVAHANLHDDASDCVSFASLGMTTYQGIARPVNRSERFHFGKKQRSCLDEAASLSEEGYRRADCSPPEHIFVTLSG